MNFYKIETNQSDDYIVFEVTPPSEHEGGIQSYVYNNKNHCYEDWWHNSFEDALNFLISKEFVTTFDDLRNLKVSKLEKAPWDKSNV